jgi:hypothetical protein
MTTQAFRDNFPAIIPKLSGRSIARGTSRTWE